MVHQAGFEPKIIPAGITGYGCIFQIQGYMKGYTAWRIKPKIFGKQLRIVLLPLW